MWVWLKTSAMTSFGEWRPEKTYGTLAVLTPVEPRGAGIERDSPSGQHLDGGPLRTLSLNLVRRGSDAMGHGWTSRPSGKVVVVVGAAAAAAPA